MTKHITHHEHVAVFVLHTDSVHAQELWQKCVTMTLHYVLGKKTRGRDKERLAERHNQHRDRNPGASTPELGKTLRGCKAKRSCSSETSGFLPATIS